MSTRDASGLPADARSHLARVTHDVRDYSRGLVPAQAWDQLVAVGRSLLEGTVVAMGAREGYLWIPAGDLSGPPMATCPRRLSPRRIRAARAAGQRAASGQRLAGDYLAVVVAGDGPAPRAVFVLARGHNAPFSKADRRLLAHLSPLLAVATSPAVTAQDQTDMTRAADPSRATLDLLATLAHEMRTPLASIKGYATALLNASGELDRAKVQEALQVIDQETATMTILISELLEAAAIDGGRLTLQLEPVLLNRLLERLVGEFARQTAVHDFEIAFPPKWPAVPGDPRRLEQVFRNILDNAVKYSPHGGTIAVKGSASRGEVVVSIADQGIGIAPADLNRLFEKFFRARRSLRVAGSGLGLPIAHAIVEQHGGRIWAESALGRGTTLHVALPRRRREGVSVR